MTPDSLAFEVVGVKPAAQGNHRRNRAGGVYDSNKRLPSFRRAVEQAARVAIQDARWPRVPFGTDPVSVAMSFGFERPACHYGTGRNADRLKPNAPMWPTGRNLGDAEKLARGVNDALSGLVFADDSQVVSLTVTKLWVHRGVSPVTEVTVVRMP